MEVILSEPAPHCVLELELSRKLFHPPYYAKSLALFGCNKEGGRFRG